MEQYKAQYPQESNTMATLSERLRAEGMQKGMQKGVEQGMQQGMEQGMQQGEAAALKKLISLKFGELPHWAEEKIQSAGLPELEIWLEAILTSDTLESLLNRH
jgi:flagellar biosynthesis/type III secretory pathway protein FliH